MKAPTLVIHGTVDPLVRPEGGKDTAASIPGAKLLMIEGMGHALPIPMWPQIIDAIDKHAHGAAAKAALVLRRDPDDVAGAAASSGGADVDFVDVEACATKPLCERRIGPGRPDGQHAARPQRGVRRLQSG